MEPSVVTIITVAASGIVTQLITAYNRRMDRKDRDERAAAAGRELSQQASRIASHNEQQTGQVIDKIAENTKVSVEAFSEANSINAKIADNNARILELAERLDMLITQLPCRDGLGKLCSVSKRVA